MRILQETGFLRVLSKQKSLDGVGEIGREGELGWRSYREIRPFCNVTIISQQRAFYASQVVLPLIFSTFFGGEGITDRCSACFDLPPARVVIWCVSKGPSNVLAFSERGEWAVATPTTGWVPLESLGHRSSQIWRPRLYPCLPRIPSIQYIIVERGRMFKLFLLDNVVRPKEVDFFLCYFNKSDNFHFLTYVKLFLRQRFFSRLVKINLFLSETFTDDSFCMLKVQGCGSGMIYSGSGSEFFYFWIADPDPTRIFKLISSDVDPDPVGSGFIWVHGSESGSRCIKVLIKWREKQGLKNKNLFFSQEIIWFNSEP